MTDPEALDRVRALLVNDFQVPEEKVTPAAHLRVDLGLDSLSLTDLAFLVKQDLGLDAVTPDAFRGVTTVGALATFVATHAR